MYNDDRDFENKNEGQSDIFDEEDIRIPDMTDTNQYHKVTEQGTVEKQVTPEFGQDEPKGQERQPEQTQWQGSTYRQSFVKQESEPKTEQKPKYSYMDDEPSEPKRAGSRQKKETKKSGGGVANPFAKAVACGLIVGVIGGGCVLGSFALGSKMFPKQAAEPTTIAEVPTTEAKLTEEEKPVAENPANAAEGSGEYTVAQIAKQCQSSVVAITNKGVYEVQTFFGTMQQESEGSGSGVIIGKNETELLIATNNHVVEGAEELTVCFNDDENAIYSAQVKGTDPTNDLAVVAIPLADISSEDMGTISIATLGDSDKLQVGDEVVAIGNALGLGQSVTQGVISATARSIDNNQKSVTLLQTDAAINPGNSGGALFNMKGELIGINSAKFASAEVEGMGFAIPITSAEPIIDNLMSRETRSKLTKDYGYLNISGQDVSQDVSSMYGVPEGVYIANAVEGGAAANAGMQEGDILTTLDGTPIKSITELKEMLQYYPAGDTVDVIVQRNSGSGYEEVVLSVTLDNATEQKQTQTQQAQSQEVPEGNEADPFGGYGNGGMGIFPFQ